MMRKPYHFFSLVVTVLLGLLSPPTFGQKILFTIERMSTGELVATLNGVVIGFGNDSYETAYEYGGSALSLSGVPEGGRTTPIGSNTKPIGRAIRVVSNAQLVTEIEAGKEAQYLRLNDVLYCGSVTARRVLWYLPVRPMAVIRRVVTDGRWETTFTYEDHPASEFPELTTRDLRTGEIVYQVFDLKSVRANVMEAREEYYRDGKVISELTTERGSIVGTLIDIKRISAPIPRNYFAIDFVLNGWPFGPSGPSF